MIVTLSNSYVVGTAAFLPMEGQGMTSYLGTITTGTENFISITGINANANIGSTTLSTAQILSMTGQSMTISLATIIPASNNFLGMTGMQANVTPVNLRFWDDINDSNTYTWTNI